MSYDESTLTQELMRDEGVKLKPYRCTAGKLTIGVGRNIEDNGISNEEAAFMLKADIKNCERDLDILLPGWKNFSDTRQRVLLNMMFNMGRSRLSGFAKFLTCLKMNDFTGAADQMMDSAWAKQVGQRAVRLRDMMLRG
jgi:lysozyme